jgi:signal transduction histidine kinase
MIFYDPVFQALSFFTLGFLCLNALISFVLNYHFKTRAYGYYLSYVVLTIFFVFTVIIMQKEIRDSDANQKLITTIIYDILRVVIFYFHSLFIYKSMIIEDTKFKKLSWLMNLYTTIVVFRVLIAIASPNFMENHPALIGVSRILVTFISFVFIYYLYRENSNTYLRFLFIASTILIIFILLSMLDSVLNNHNSTLRGFMFFCVGIILENICFVSVFIFQIIRIDGEKKLTEILHQEQLNTVQIEMQQQTMEHIGRDIHDNIGQKLTLASLYIQQLAYENKTHLINNNIENIGVIINQSLSQLRGLSKSLTDNHTKSNTIHQLLQLECDAFNEIKKCKLTFDSNFNNLDLPYQSKIVLLRIAQEFIQNSIKHSGCKNIKITLSKIKHTLQLSLQDDGSGFDTNKKTIQGIGLSNIKKRVQIIAGVYDLVSNEKGTKLIIKISF